MTAAVRPTPTILVVDDDDSIRELTSMTLEVVDEWNVIAASNGQAAVALAKQHDPDAVLLDLMMPVMDGRTFLKEIESDSTLADVPVILLTAATERFQSPRVTGLMKKPFDIDEIIQAATEYAER